MTRNRDSKGLAIVVTTRISVESHNRLTNHLIALRKRMPGYVYVSESAFLRSLIEEALGAGVRMK